MRKTSNKVFIATSIDGYIADKNGGLDWLHSIPNPDQNDMGYKDFTDRIDAIVMGKTTFETVLGFDIDWPYSKPVYVLSTTLKSIPDKLKDKVFIVNGELKSVLQEIHQNGHFHLYIDGGRTIQSFLKEDLIDELILSTIPVLLGGGSRLFSDHEKLLNFEFHSNQVYLNQINQVRYLRKR
jgi:dihydrofolate reductase